MYPDPYAIIKPLVERLHDLAQRDAVLRDQLRELGTLLVALADAPAQPPAAPAHRSVMLAPETVAPSSNHLPAPVDENAAASFVAGPPTDHGGSVEQAAMKETPPRRAYYVSNDELPLIEERCRLKAEAARWAAIRQQRMWQGDPLYADIEATNQSLIARARALPDCFLWMTYRDAPVPVDPSRYDDLARCFDVAADAVALLYALVEAQQEDQGWFEQALLLAAEAQSAIRAAVQALNEQQDSDQYKLFWWLRTTSTEQQIWINRWMRAGDAADPTATDHLRARIKELAADIQHVRNRDKRRQSTLNKLQYHLKLIQTHPAAERLHDWRKIIESVDALLDDGMPPSNRDIRALLMPVLDALPEAITITPSFALVLRDIDRYLAAQPVEPSTTAPSPPSAEVQQAAALLRGQVMVLIGGERRAYTVDALKTAFELRDLIWIETREHQTHTVFEPYVARPDVAVVVLAIRWASHGFSEVKAYCDKYNKPLVRLPAGYNINQVAGQLVHQVGQRLAAAQRATTNE